MIKDKVIEFLGIQDFIRKPKDPVEAAKQKFDPETLGPKEVYLEWESSLKKEGKGINKKFSRAFIVIAIVVGLLLAIMQDFMLIIGIGSVVFITYVFSNYKVGNIKFEISNHGIKFDETMYYWHQLHDFYFSSRMGDTILAVDTNLGLPGRLFISFEPGMRDQIKAVVEKYIPYIKEEPKTSLDKAYDSVISKFNFEDK